MKDHQKSGVKVVVSKKNERLSFSYYYRPIVQGGLLRHGHGGNKIDVDDLSDAFSLKHYHNRHLDWIATERRGPHGPSLHPWPWPGSARGP